jgi:hypothetical protein
MLGTVRQCRLKDKTLKSLGTKKRGVFSETATRFQVKFFERFGKLFSKKVFQGFDLVFKL